MPSPAHLTSVCLVRCIPHMHVVWCTPTSREGGKKHNNFHERDSSSVPRISVLVFFLALLFCRGSRSRFFTPHTRRIFVFAAGLNSAPPTTFSAKEALVFIRRPGGEGIDQLYFIGNLFRDYSLDINFLVHFFLQLADEKSQSAVWTFDCCRRTRAGAA